MRSDAMRWQQWEGTENSYLPSETADSRTKPGGSMNQKDALTEPSEEESIRVYRSFGIITSNLKSNPLLIDDDVSGNLN